MAYCGKCGTQLNEGAKFCPKCGNACDEKSNSTSKKGSNKKKPLIITASVAIVLALLCCCVFVWRNLGKDYSLKGLADIVADYDDIDNFYDGMARVTKGDKVGFIDKKGNEVIPCVYDPINMETQINFSCGLVLVCKDNKLFFINKKGEKAFNFDYDWSNGFSEGYAVVTKNDKFGFINTEGEEVVKCIYDFAEDFSDGMALVSSDNKYGYIDTKGNVVIPISYELTGELGFGSFHDGLAPIVKNGKYGYIDKNGKEVISCKYDESYSFSEGLAVIAKDGKYGFIDTKGNEVVPCEFDYADSFVDGKASVRKDEKVMLIDKSGKVVFTASDNNNYTFKDGLARVTKEINGDYLTGFIDINGKEVIPCIYSSWQDFSEGLVAVSKDGINGYVDKDGKSTFDYLSEDIVAKFKEKQRIEKQKQEEEQRKREEENKPTNRFFNLASDYMWESEGYGYDFGSGERTQLLFYPSNKGGGRITYQNLSTDYSSIFRGYSATSTYQVSDGFISCTIIGDKSEIPWELNLNFAIENMGNSVRLVRLLDKPVQRWSNRQGKIVTYDKIFYSPKPKGNDYTK